MHKLIRVYVTVCWAFFIFKLLTLPMPAGGPELGVEIDGLDKLVHFFLFGLLSYFLAKTLELYIKDHHRSVLVASLILPGLYGLLFEYIQAGIPGRSEDYLDASAGSAGSLLAIWIYHYLTKVRKPKLLLHVCCIGCGAYVAKLLKKDFRPVLFFYNPNIYPETEYFKRLDETRRIAKILNLPVITGEYKHPVWRELIKGHEDDQEKGGRCLICYRERLEETARLAKAKRIVWFGSTLSVSPHKLAAAISDSGHDAGKRYGVNFYDRDYKKQDGFKKSAELSRSLGLYRQDYCGCEFSRKHITHNT